MWRQRLPTDEFGFQTDRKSVRKSVISSRARRRRYIRRWSCGVRIASTTDGLPATPENETSAILIP